MTISNNLQPKLEIIQVPISELIENPHHARIHPEKQLAKLRSAIREFGFIVPVLIDRNKRLLAGQARMVAGRDLGLTHLPAICIDHLSEVQRRAFVLADAKIAEGAKWDEHKLALELQAILELDGTFEFESTGFTIGELDYAIEGLHRPGDEDEPPLDPGRVDAVCRSGDLWLLGDRHRLFCGDALDPVSHQVVLGGERASMVIADPPYNLPIPGVVSGKGKAQHTNFVQASGEMTTVEFRAFLREATRCARGGSVDGSIHYFFMDWRNIDTLVAAGRDVFDELKNVCVWNKGSGSMGSLYRGQHELIAVFKAGTAKHCNHVELGVHGRTRTNVWDYPGMSRFGKGRADAIRMHPTVKPVALLADAILDCSRPNSIVLDPFGGVGSTAVACARTNRRSALIEIDPHYCDVALRRFCDVTGIKPVNAWTGEVVSRKPNARADQK